MYTRAPTVNFLNSLFVTAQAQAYPACFCFHQTHLCTTFGAGGIQYNLHTSTEAYFCLDPKLQLIILTLLNGVEFGLLCFFYFTDAHLLLKLGCQ
jgi:hypothetical protein